MSNSLVILNVGDIAAAQQIAVGLSDFQVVVFDPGLVDRVAAAQIGPLRRLHWDGAPSFRRLSDDAHATAAAIERRLDALVDARLPGLSIQSWQHLSLYYLHQALEYYSQLFEQQLDALAGTRVLMPLCDNAQTYYFPSFVPALLLLQCAQRKGLEFQAYTYGGLTETPQMLPALRGVRAHDGREFVLTHLPTCLYDIEHFNAELAAAGKPLVNLGARYFDQPVAAETQVAVAALDELQAELPAEQLALIDALAAELAQTLDEQLGRWITAPAYRARQAGQLAAVYRAQLVGYQLLERHFGEKPPSKLLFSDHDADFHGPLLAFARRHQLPLLVLPHSKTSGDLDFSYRNTVALYHPVQGEGVHDDQGRRVAQFALDMPTTLHFDTQSRGPLKTIGLLLNAVSLNGVPLVEFPHFIDGIRRIAGWCSAAGVELVIRFKPGYTMIHQLCEQVGLDADALIANTQGSMAEFSARIDLCLMFGAPTSGALEMLCKSVPILGALAGEITQAQAATIDAAIVPRGDIAETLRRVAGFAADEPEFQRFRKQQFLAFAASFANAQPLRNFV